MPDAQQFPDRFRPGAPDWLVESARKFIDRAEWKFASTMASNPHWYVMRYRAEAAGLGLPFTRLYILLRDYHYLRRWHGRSYRSIDFEGYSYWLMDDGAIINRKPIDTAGWDR